MYRTKLKLVHIQCTCFEVKWMWFSWQYIDVFCFAFKVTRWNQINLFFYSLSKSPDGTRLILFVYSLSKSPDGTRLARVSYSPIHSVNILTKSARERQQRKGNMGDDWLDTLRHHLRWMQIQRSRRFVYETVTKAYKQMQKDGEKVDKCMGKYIQI